MGSQGHGGAGLGSLIAVPLIGFVVLVALVVGLAAGFGAGSSSACTSVEAVGDVRGVPKKLIPIYQQAAAKYRLGPKGPAMLASINWNETGFGTNMNNTTGSGAMGWMMFMPETWSAYGVDGNGDGTKDPYNPWDAIFAAARYLRASGAPGDWYEAIFAYNHADWYVKRVEGDFRRFQGDGLESLATGSGANCSGTFTGDAALKDVERLTKPREFKALPSRYWVGGGSPQAVDARLWPNAVWFLSTFKLVVTAARESGHNTHGDGTALDIVPAAGQSWEDTAERGARALGWLPGCGASGTAPVCPLVPAIQFIGYNGYPSHGDPAHAGGNAHLHVSWKSASFSSGELSPPPAWVAVFPLSG